MGGGGDGEGEALASVLFQVDLCTDQDNYI